MTEPLSNEILRKMLEESDKNKRGSTVVKNRGGKKYDTNERTYRVWFALDNSTMDLCTVKPCHSHDNRDTEASMVNTINGIQMCRYCFLAGVGRTDE